ncbi:MAG: superinfection immunity protein [Candidatus Acidiferrales bacterium]
MTFLLVAVFLYFLPTFVGRNRHDATGIFLVNFVLGWTVIGWVAAMIWACTPDMRVPVMAVAGHAYAYPQSYAGPGPGAYTCASAKSNAHFCSQCGAATQSGARYCTYCGRCV